MPDSTALRIVDKLTDKPVLIDLPIGEHGLWIDYRRAGRAWCNLVALSCDDAEALGKRLIEAARLAR